MPYPRSDPDGDPAHRRPEGATARRLDLADLPDGRLAVVRSIWDLARGTRPMPKRGAILPEDLRGALGYVNIVEVEREPLRFRFRLIGGEVASAYGRDMTGRPVDEVEPEPYRDLLMRQFADVVAEGAPLLHEVRFVQDWRDHWLVRLSLPLSEDGDEVTGILTASAFEPTLRHFDLEGFIAQLRPVDDHAATGGR